MNYKKAGPVVIVLLIIAAAVVFKLAHFFKPSHGKPAGLVALWAGDANDSVGGDGATFNDISFEKGKVGRAYSFNGSTSWIKLPASRSLDIGAGRGFTIECWIMPSAFDVDVSGAPIIEWDSETTDGMQLWSGGELFANLKDTSGRAHNINLPGLTLSTNEFQHVALTYDKSSGHAIIYYNGTMVTNVFLGSIIPQTTYPVNIGKRTGQPIGLNDTYGGLIDGLSIYNRALSASEIRAIYRKAR